MPTLPTFGKQKERIGSPRPLSQLMECPVEASSGSMTSCLKNRREGTKERRKGRKGWKEKKKKSELCKSWRDGFVIKPPYALPEGPGLIPSNSGSEPSGTPVLWDLTPSAGRMGTHTCGAEINTGKTRTHKIKCFRKET